MKSATFAFRGGVARMGCGVFRGLGRTWGTRLRRDGGEGGICSPVGHGGGGKNASTRPRNRSASGQAAAKAMRTRLVVSTRRAAILRSLSLIFVNSGVGGGGGWGIFL